MAGITGNRYLNYERQGEEVLLFWEEHGREAEHPVRQSSFNIALSTASSGQLTRELNRSIIKAVVPKDSIAETNLDASNHNSPLGKAQQADEVDHSSQRDETPWFRPPFPMPPDPVIEVYKKDVDRTLLRENLRLTIEERFLRLMELQRFAEELLRAGREARKPR